MTESLLPEPFSDLEPLVSLWALPTERERNRKRLTSGMDELRGFYDSLAPRAVAALEYLQPLPCNDVAEADGGLSAAQRRLQWLLFALAEVAPAIEVFSEPAVIGGFDAARFIPNHDLSDWQIDRRRKDQTGGA